MPYSRRYSLMDQFCLQLDQAVRTILNNPITTTRDYPASQEKEVLLSVEQKKQSAALMRVNHAGEVCAQALYHGQSLFSKTSETRQKMQQAAQEEGDHLVWCQQRLQELNSHTSYFNPLWYTSSFLIGCFAGMWGDQWSLGFLAETEQQVVNHLESHFKKLPFQDHKSLKILQQMQIDETKHRDDAEQLGAAVLPAAIQKLMGLTSKIMVTIAYYF